MEWVIAGGNDDFGGLRKKIRPAAKLGCSRVDARNQPNGTRKLHSLVIFPQQGWAAERRGQTPRAVDDAADHRRIFMIRSGDGIDSKHRDAERSSIERNRIDVDGVVILDRLRRVLQVGDAFAYIEVPDEDFRESRLGGSATGASAGPLFGVMNGEGGRIEVALVIESGLLDEAFIVRIVGDGEKRFAAARPAYPSEVGVKKSVSSGQQARGFRRSSLAQFDGEGYRRGNENDRESDGESASNSHE